MNKWSLFHQIQHVEEFGLFIHLGYHSASKQLLHTFASAWPHFTTTHLGVCWSVRHLSYCTMQIIPIQRPVNLKRVLRLKHANGMYMLKPKTSDAQVNLARIVQNNNSSNSSRNIWILRNRNVHFVEVITGILWISVENFILAAIIIHWSKLLETARSIEFWVLACLCYPRIFADQQQREAKHLYSMWGFFLLSINVIKRSIWKLFALLTKP